MTPKVKTYYYFLLGCLGGLTGWFVISMLPGIKDVATNIYVPFAIRGSILGCLIGFFISSYEGSASFRRLLRFGSIGLVIGGLGGAVSFPLSQFLYQYLIVSSKTSITSTSLNLFMLGMVCWIVFGGIIGFIEGIGKGTQLHKGLVGGLIGGVVGGLIYETARFYGNLASENSFTQRDYIWQAVSFVFLGGAIGAAVSLVTTLFSYAEIILLNGKHEGTPYDITKFVNPKSVKEGSIGSDYQDNVFIPGDNEVLGKHALLFHELGIPKIRISEGAKKVGKDVKVNKRPISSWDLKDGDIIQVGSTSMRYKQAKRS